MRVYILEIDEVEKGDFGVPMLLPKIIGVYAEWGDANEAGKKAAAEAIASAINPYPDGDSKLTRYWDTTIKNISYYVTEHDVIDSPQHTTSMQTK